MTKVAFKGNKKMHWILSVILIIVATIVAFGLFNKPISAYASSSTNELFVSRTTNTDLTGNSYSVTSTPAITVITHGLGGNNPRDFQ